MSTLPGIFNDALAGVLREIHPKSILRIGALPLPALEDYADKHPDCDIRQSRDPLGSPDRARPVDLAIVACSLGERPRPDSSALLARLRDLMAHAVVVIHAGDIDATEAWQPADFRAFGFRCLGAVTEGDKFWQLHEFNIDNYKPTPEWLNAKHWANPELFDKFRW